MLVSQYNPILVVLSFVVAILAAYTALNMAARVAGSEGVAARVWLAAVLLWASAYGPCILSACWRWTSP